MAGLSILLLAFLSLCFIEPQGAMAQQSSDPEAAPTLDQFDRSRRDVPDTVMFSIDELTEIQTRQQGGQISGIEYRSGAIEDANLFLSSIVYFGSDEWTFWINGVAITPSFKVDTFEVVNISPTHVELIVPLSAAGVRPVHLQPNQTFIGESGRVVEGAFN